MSKNRGEETSHGERATRWQVAESRLVGMCSRAMQRSSWAGCRRTGSLVGLAFYYGVRNRRHVAIDNVQIAFPQMGQEEARRIARRGAQNLGMTFCESLHMGGASLQELNNYVELQGLEHIEAALERGRGAVLLMAHFGNWELFGARLSQQIPLSVLARPNSNSGVEGVVAQVRTRVGMEVISKWDTARPAVKALRANRALGLLPDQRAGKGEGVLLPMFGRVTRFYSSVAQFSLMSGAPIIPGFGVRREPWLSDGRIIGDIRPALKLRPDDEAREDASRRRDPALKDPTLREAAILDGTRHVIGALEDAIRRHPDQWWWLHRRWRSSDRVAHARMNAAASRDVTINT